MNAIKLLEQQHDEVEDLFEKAEKATGTMKRNLFIQLADALTIHATIEEKLFYPSVKVDKTEEQLLESVEEHLGVKRVLADMIDLDPSDDTFDAKLKVLCDLVMHHVEEERSEVLPQAKKILSKEQLEALGQEMEAMIDSMEGSEPRLHVKEETQAAAHI
jgi:hypothetical protein